MNRRTSILIALTLVSISITAAYAASPTPEIIKLDIPALDKEDSAGGIIAADVNNDRLNVGDAVCLLGYEFCDLST